MRKSKPSLSKSSSVLFVTFSRWDKDKRTPTNGSLDPLRDFLVPKIKKLVIIDQPHPSGDGVMPIIEEHLSNGKYKVFKSSWWIYLLKPWLSMPRTDPNATYISFKIRDFLSVIDWSFRDKTTFDYFIGLESINTIAGILLRKLGRIQKVVYYVSDYSPNRYPGKIFNSIYLSFDRFCATNADFIWDVSKAMQPARIQAGLSSKKSATAIHVPNGLLPGQIEANPVSKINKNDLVYMGTLGAENGPDVAIKALGIVRKKFPKTKLHIVGGTDKDFSWIRKIINKNKLENSVVFHGFIPDSIKMSEIMRACAIGLAPYKNIPGSIRLYADAGKIRAYCASGLPVVSSTVPPLGRDVEKIGGAIIVNDDPKSFAKAILSIFEDPKLYLRLRRNAILFAKDSTWENTFSNAFNKM